MRTEGRGIMSAPKNSNLPPNILVIDDDTTVAQGLEGPFKGYNIAVKKAKDITSTVQSFEEEVFPPVVLIELEFEPMNGLVLVQRLRRHLKANRRASGIILLTGKARNPSDEVMIKELGDMESVVKPLKPINILPIISKAFAKHGVLTNFEQFREVLLIDFAKGVPHKTLVERAKEKFGEYGVRAFELIVEIYEHAKDFESGLHFTNGFLQKDANNTLYMNAKAKFLMLAGRSNEALDLLEAAHKLAPLSLDRLSMLEDAYLKNKQPKKALEVMEQRVQFLKGHLESKFEMANKLETHGHEEEAKGFVRKHASPMDVVRYYNNRGVALSQSGDPTKALAEYEKALSYFPSSKENYRIHYNIGLAKLKTKNPSDVPAAIGSLKKCLELEPGFEKAQSVLNQVQGSNKQAS